MILYIRRDIGTACTAGDIVIRCAITVPASNVVVPPTVRVVMCVRASRADAAAAAGAATTTTGYHQLPLLLGAVPGRSGSLLHAPTVG